jgi:hypothetical protein
MIHPANSAEQFKARLYASFKKVNYHLVIAFANSAKSGYRRRLGVGRKIRNARTIIHAYLHDYKGTNFYIRI